MFTAALAAARASGDRLASLRAISSVADSRRAELATVKQEREASGRQEEEVDASALRFSLLELERS